MFAHLGFTCWPCFEQIQAVKASLLLGMILWLTNDAAPFQKHNLFGDGSLLTWTVSQWQMGAVEPEEKRQSTTTLSKQYRTVQLAVYRCIGSWWTL